MTYGELENYIGSCEQQRLPRRPLHRGAAAKVAFPFVTLVMTLLAVPFAVSTGRSGALFGVGIGLILAIVYWTTLSVFSAMGAGGWLSPMLAAWAPNILFGCAAGLHAPDGRVREILERAVYAASF